ncbi:MAG: tyrosine--tRNA ligase [Deltaproteobacteria bacterium]|nr:tyrosine--tRNA ligase [Deltaproteobacteria bacterium]
MAHESSNLFDIFRERGFFKQCTSDEVVRGMFSAGPVVAYIGFDPTARSLHAGSLVPIMALMHMERTGHHPIALVGGGTGLVGDPSGKTEQRQILTRDDLRSNFDAIKAQIGRFLDIDGGQSIAVDNADWLEKLNYIEFLRDIGRHFSVNRMLSFESYRIRLQKGLSFLEFNYQLLQAYDFLVLFQRHGCRLQMGGDDQWGNIVAGTELIRRVEGVDAHGLTFPLLETASGAKMGKTAKGALWLDPKLTSPYEYYQYWVNTDDRDVGRFLRLFTFLPMDEVRRLETLAGEEAREAKRILAFEATSVCHGAVAAEAARDGAAAAFGGADGASDGIPTTRLSRERVEHGVRATELFVEIGLMSSKGEAAKLFKAGGGWIGERQLRDHNEVVGITDFPGGEALVRAGRKHRHRLVLEDQ